MRERHKRDIVMKIDPETKEKYWSNEVVTVYKPDEEDSVNAVLDILKEKIWHQTVSLLRGECPGYGLGILCGLFGYS